MVSSAESSGTASPCAEVEAPFPDAFDFLFEPARYKIAYGGRGSGKSWAFARALLIQGLGRKLRILCARELQRSIADSCHKLLADQIIALGFESFYTVQKATIQGANGTEFIFSGLKNSASLKSTEQIDICWVEEAQVISKASYEILTPTIRASNSELWFSLNPGLESDFSYRQLVLNPPPGALCRKVNYNANPWFPEVLRVEMEHLKLTDPDAYAHVYEGECKSALEGAIFAGELKKATEEGRITQVPYNRTRPVDTAWDLGFGDMTTVWFVQTYDGWFHFIDYLEGSGETIADYIIKLQNRGYVYGTDWLPHDAVDTIIHSKLAGNDRTMSIEMLMRQAGRKVRIAPKLYVHDRINAARTIFSQCRFDAEKCADGLQALRHYQWAPPSKDGVPKREPLHNWASHGADGFQAAAVAIRQPKPTPPHYDPFAGAGASGPGSWMG